MPEPGRGAEAPQPGAQRDARAEHDHAAAQYQQALISRRCRRADDPARRSRISQARTSRPGSRSSWWTATAPARVFGGGLKIRTTLDLELQRPPSRRSPGALAGVGPERVAGGDRQQDRRDPGDGRRLRLRAARPSTSPPRGIASPARRSSRSRSSPRSRRASRPDARSCRRPKTFRSRAAAEHFKVNNYKDTLLGRRSRSPARPTDSDNSVYARGGLQGRARSKIARLAQRMGVRTPLSTQPGDDARRPQGGRHAARDGERLLDARQRRRARDGLARRLRRRARSAIERGQAATAARRRQEQACAASG